MTIRSFRTVYEVNKPDQQFYSVERNGLVSAKEVVWHAINDLTYRGAFTVANVMYRNTLGLISNIANADVTYGSWPIRETVFTISNYGSGYTVGDQVQLDGGTYTEPLVLQVTGIKAGTSAINSYEVIGNPIYTVPPSGTATTSFISGEQAVITLSGNLTSSKGFKPTYLGSSYNGATVNTKSFGAANVSQWRAFYGNNGSGGTGGPISNTTWPSGGAWYWSKITGSGNEAGTDITIGLSGNAKIGQRVTLVSGTGSVPANTTITDVKTIKIYTSVDTTYSTFVGGYPVFVDEAQYLTFSNNVTLNEGDVITCTGAGLSFTSGDTQIPNTFTAILEAGAAADPLNDAVGVFANVNGATSDVKSLSVDGLTTQNSFLPSIYTGQRVISYTPLLSLTSLTRSGTTVTVTTSAPHNLSNGDTVIVGGANELDYNGIFVITVSSGTVFTYTALAAPSASPATGSVTVRKQGSIDGTVTVTNVSMNTTHTTANLVLSSNQSLPDNEKLQFIFDQLQPWRLVFEVIEEQVAAVYAGTSVQFSDAARIPKVSNTDGVYIDRAGIMGNVIPSTLKGELTYTGNLRIHPSVTADVGFINRQKRVAEYPEAYPLNYALTITNRGLFFGVWEGSWSVMQKTRQTLDNYFNWFVIQRPVDRLTGRALTTGRAPVFCINSVGYKYWKFIVRESDVLHPTQGDPQCESRFANSNVITASTTIETRITPYRVPADAHSQDSFAILNSSNQIALSEDSKYLVSFLHNLSTPRFRYSEELDMVGQTSADVCMASNDISITAYNESGPRLYRALSSNGSYNTGLRIAMLRDIPT